MCHRVRTYDSMLKKIVLLVLAFAAFPIVAYATPVSWDFTSNILQPLLSGATALVKADHFQATSTTPSLFPYASTTAISGTALCLGTDCRTTWPSGSVSSVFGRTGVITAQSGDYNTSQVTESGNLYFTNARAQGAVSATYPVLDSSGIFSLAFGTTTTNNWSNLQTFNGGATLANNVTLSGVTGSTQCLHVNTLGQVSGTGVDCGSSSGGVTSIATTYPITGGTITTTGTIGFNGLSTSTPWTNGFLPYITSGNTLMGVATSSLSASGPIGLTGTAGALVGGTSLTITCSTCNTSNATVSSVGLSSSNSTLTIGSTPVTTSGTLTADLNLSHANIWSALQSFSNSSTSFASQTNTSWFGATATTTINADGLGSLVLPSTGNITLSGRGTSAGSFVAFDTAGKLIATTTPTGSNFFSNSGIYTYLSTGTNLGIGTSTPSSLLTIANPSIATSSFAVVTASSTVTAVTTILTTSQSWSPPGGVSYFVIQVIGSGGGGEGGQGSAKGGNGAATSFVYNSGGNTVQANGGGGGGAVTSHVGGTGGTASGGDTNTTGTAGANNSSSTAGSGASAVAGISGTYTPGVGGGAATGGGIGSGGGGGTASSGSGGSGGGAGGYASIKLTAAQIGASATITVSGGGGGGADASTNGGTGGNGGTTSGSAGSSAVAGGGGGGASGGGGGGGGSLTAGTGGSGFGGGGNGGAGNCNSSFGSNGNAATNSRGADGNGGTLGCYSGAGGGGGGGIGGNATSPGAGGGGGGEVVITSYTTTTTTTTAGLTVGYITAGTANVGTSTTTPAVGIGTSTPSATFSEESFFGDIIEMIGAVINNVHYVVQEIDSTGGLITGGPSPTCGTGCTSVQGDKRTMRILTGSSVSSVTVNFANAWAESPICIPTDMSGVNTGVEASTTVSSVTLTLATALTTKYIGVICQQSNNFSF